MEQGQHIPNIKIQGTSNLQANLHDYLGQWVVLYFYPKDATPGCTLEAQEFTARMPEFDALGVKVLGVSKDTLVSHEKFKQKECLSFELISDSNEVLCRAFDVLKMKNRYGRVSEGIERSTFLIDADGIIKKVWRNVKASDHAQSVLETIKQLKAA